MAPLTRSTWMPSTAQIPSPPYHWLAASPAGTRTASMSVPEAPRGAVVDEDGGWCATARLEEGVAAVDAGVGLYGLVRACQGDGPGGTHRWLSTRAAAGRPSSRDAKSMRLLRSAWVAGSRR